MVVRMDTSLRSCKPDELLRWNGTIVSLFIQINWDYVRLWCVIGLSEAFFFPFRPSSRCSDEIGKLGFTWSRSLATWAVSTVIFRRFHYTAYYRVTAVREKLKLYFIACINCCSNKFWKTSYRKFQELSGSKESLILKADS